MTISTYLSIITLTWHGLNALIKKHRVGDQIFRKAYNMLSIRDPQQGKGHTQTEKSEYLESSMEEKVSTGCEGLERVLKEKVQALQ